MTDKERTYYAEALQIAVEEYNAALKEAKNEAGLTVVMQTNTDGSLYIRKVYVNTVKYFIGKDGA
jgi:hypothetical protein